jgi:hypothetical protein
MTLETAEPGDRVVLATNDRAIVLVQIPKKNPTSTRLRLIDDFTDEPEDHPIEVDSKLGVISMTPRGTKGKVDDDHAGEKDADLVDPMAVRARANAGGGGPLL